MLGVFTPKMISPDCPFKSNQRLPKISILTLRCAFWLPMWCTPRSLTLRYDAQHGAWLLGMMHTAEFYEKLGSLDSTVWCTLRSLTLWYDANRRVWLRVVQHTAESDYFENVRFWIDYVFNYVLLKNVLSKKDSWNNLWPTVSFS